jgi:diacylglycerol O-acyltransferase
MPLDAVMLVKETAGVTVNDVALAVVAGALRHYLQAREDLPTRPLVANVPVAVPTGEMPPRTFGNRFSNLTTTLATDVADPWTRLRVISEVTALAKQGHALLGPELLPDWLECVPPFVAEPAVRRYHRSRSMNRDKADASIGVSTVRSSADRWSFASAEVDEVTFGGPPNNGIGSNVVMFTNCNRVDVGILSVADSIRDPQELADGIQRALDELVASARARAATVTESMEREAPGVADG